MYANNFSGMRKLLLVVLSLLFIFPCFLFSGGADSSLEEDRNNYKSLESQLSQIKSSQSKIKDSIADAKNNKSSAIELKTLLDKEISLIVQEIETINLLIEEYKSSAEQTRAEIAALEEDMYANYVIFRDRIVLTYETGDAEYIDFILGAYDFSDFLSRVEYTKDLIEYDKSVMERLEKDKKELENKKALRELAIDRCDEILLQRASQESELAAKRTYANDLISAYENDIVKYEQLEQEVAEDMEFIKNMLAELAKQIKDKEQKLYAGGLMQWPLEEKYYITSEYGYRTHPVTGALYSFHNGIDIGTYGNSPKVMATGYGTVIYAGYRGTYGNCVMIDHGIDTKGRTIVTLYAHLDSYCVKSGQVVKAGTKIGNVGSTGRSTGNHLHLTVMLDGSPVDPGDYVYIWPARLK